MMTEGGAQDCNVSAPINQPLSFYTLHQMKCNEPLLLVSGIGF